MEKLILQIYLTVRILCFKRNNSISKPKNLLDIYKNKKFQNIKN